MPVDLSRTPRPLLLSLLAVISFGFALVAPAPVCAQSAVRVTKVEPPNWWVGLTPEVTLLLSGEGFDGASVSCEAAGVRASAARATAGGRYLFVTLAVDSSAASGSARCAVHGGAAGVPFDFSLAARASVAGKYQGFSPDDVMYLIMPDRFADGDTANDAAATHVNRADPRAYHGGDLRGIEQHLDYIAGLGATTIWLTPIVDNTDETGRDYHGYGATDEYAVEEHLGTMKDLQSLVAAAHQRHMKLVLDFVPNHVGPTHPWAALPPEPDWFHGTREHHTVSSGDFQFVTDPHAPEKYWHNVEDGWFANVLPDLNQDNPDVARYFIQNALWWAEMSGIDGYRLDTFPYVSRGFWRDWHAALRATYPQMTTVGEVMNGDPTIVSFFAGGQTVEGIDTGLWTPFDYPMFFAVREGVVEKASTKRVVETLAADHLYPHPENLVTLVGNHDVPRLAGMKGITPARIKLVFGLTTTLRGIPQLYYGDEIGMPGGGDPDNRRDFPGGFPGDKANAFVESGRTPEQQDIFAYVQSVLKLRGAHEALSRGALWDLHFDEDSCAFARVADSEKLIVVVNAGASEKQLKFSLAETPVAGVTAAAPLFGASDATAAAKIDGTDFSVTLKPATLAVYAVR
jgi:neopullulanase